MVFHIKIYDSKFSSKHSDITVTNDMRVKDVIPLLRVQSKIKMSNDYGLMIECNKTGNCHWIPSDIQFDHAVIDSNDKVFLHPLKRSIKVEVIGEPIKTLVIDLTEPTKNIVVKCCQLFKIYPHNLWGAYIHARNNLIMLNNEQSIAEQAIKFEKIYLRQYIFPPIDSTSYIHPLYIYIKQYRMMAVKREFCTEKDDQEILKRYSWYKCSNPFINFPNDEKEQEKEFNLFINLKSFGELNYLVRMRIGNMFKKQSSNESIYNLIIAKNYISSFKYGDLNRTFVCSYDAIKSIGINDYELIISFGSNECWKIISHRNFEIFSIIHANMKNINLIPYSSNGLSCDEISFEEIFQTPESNFIQKDIDISKLFDESVKLYSEVANLKKIGALDQELAIKEIKLNSMFSKLSNSPVLNQSSLITEFNNGKEALNVINNSFENLKIQGILHKIDEIIYKNKANRQFRENEEIIKSVNLFMDHDANVEVGKEVLNLIEKCDKEKDEEKFQQSLRKIKKLSLSLPMNDAKILNDSLTLFVKSTNQGKDELLSCVSKIIQSNENDELTKQFNRIINEKTPKKDDKKLIRTPDRKQKRLQGTNDISPTNSDSEDDERNYLYTTPIKKRNHTSKKSRINRRCNMYPNQDYSPYNQFHYSHIPFPSHGYNNYNQPVPQYCYPSCQSPWVPNNSTPNINIKISNTSDVRKIIQFNKDEDTLDSIRNMTEKLTKSLFSDKLEERIQSLGNMFDSLKEKLIDSYGILPLLMEGLKKEDTFFKSTKQLSKLSKFLQGKLQDGELQPLEIPKEFGIIKEKPKNISIPGAKNDESIQTYVDELKKSLHKATTIGDNTLLSTNSF